MREAVGPADGVPKNGRPRDKSGAGEEDVPGVRGHFTVTTGQWALRITYWVVEPNTSFPTLERLRVPM